MKILTKIVFFLTLLGLILVLLNVEFIPKRKRVLACDPYGLTGLKSVTPESAFSLDPVDRMAARDGNWSVVSGDQKSRAEKKTVETYRRLVCFVPYVEKFSVKSDEELKVFGLEQPGGQLTVIGKETVLLSRGDDTPSGTEFYLTTSSDPGEVYLVPNSIKKALFPTFMDLRIRRPLSDLKEDWDGGDFGLEFQGARVVLNPQDREELISLLSFLSYTNFHSPMRREEAAIYGFEMPDIILEWKSKDGLSHREEISRSGGGFFYSLMPSEVEARFYVLILESKTAGTLFEKLKEISLHDPS